MSTPSKEALKAAKEFRATVVGLSNDSTDKLAAIIDRHIEPLRQRAEQAEQKARDWETAANLYQLDFQTEAARAEQAEARVKELENGLKHQCETCEMKSVFDGEHDFAVKMQSRVKELEAEAFEAQVIARNSRSELYALRAALDRHAAGEPAKHPDSERLEFAFAHDMIVNRRMESWVKTREQFDAQRGDWEAAARKEVQP